MERSRPEKEGTILLQTTVMKKKMARFLLETEAGAEYDDKRELDVVDEIAPAPVSTLRKKRRTVMSKAVKDMDPLCSIYHVNYRSLVEEHKLGVGGDLIGREDFVWSYPSYNVRSNRRDDYAE